MSFCNVCKYQIIDDSVQTCPNCGAPVEIAAQGVQDTVAEEDRLSNQQPDHIHSADNSADSIEICDPGTFIGAVEDETDFSDFSDDEHIPIGQTSSPLPPQVDSESSSDQALPDDNHEAHQIQKLSPEQAAKIRSAFEPQPEENENLTPEDASSMMNQIAGDDSDSDYTPPESEQTELNRVTNIDDATLKQIPSRPVNKESDPLPEIEPTPSVRRIAYFHKNFIQLTGPHYPKTGEELILDDQHYLLKPKKIKQQYTIAMFAVVAAILLFFAGRYFISPTLPGEGSIIGILLDDDGRPFESTAEITLPEAGKKTTTDPLGFFRFDNIATGTYVIRYQFPDGSVGTDNISVVGSQITTLSLGYVESDQSDYAYTRPTKQPPSSRKSGQRQTTESSPPPPGPQPKSVSKKQYSSLKLKANVEGAKLTASGSVLGSGNLVYKKLQPGTHKVMVSKSGYKAWNGSVTLKPDQTYSLTVNLEKIETAPVEEPTYSARDFYQSGQTMLANGNMNSAIDDFTEAINLDPNLADAYRLRGDAYRLLGNKTAAENDLIKAAEIMAGQKRTETAHELYAQVLSINKKSAAAYLGQAALYARQNNADKAIKAYKSAVKYDKNNFRANFALGKIYFSMHKNKWADEWLKKAKDINPKSPEVYHYLMLNYFARDDFNKVQKTYTDFKSKMNQDQIADFKANPKFEPIIRVVGEYERP